MMPKYTNLNHPGVFIFIAIYCVQNTFNRKYPVDLPYLLASVLAIYGLSPSTLESVSKASCQNVLE